MLRCLDLARQPGGKVGLNPNVGAVLVHDGVIIGEGAYEEYGGSHAEVIAIESVSAENRSLISESTLYVSLEPCNFHGKTPPCADRILTEEIKKVVVGCEDPNPRIAGSSIEFLRNQNVEVEVGSLQQACEDLIKPFSVNVLQERPYITLKWAQTKDFFIGRSDEQVWLSNQHSKVFSHKLRSENHGILVGTATAMLDNPELTNRLYFGSSPLRIIIDLKNKIPQTHRLLADDEPLLILNSEPRADLKSMKEQWSGPLNLSSMLKRLYIEKSVGRMIVEGGANTITRFVEAGLWDIAMVIRTNKVLKQGIKAPHVVGKLREETNLAGDVIQEIWR